MKEGGAVRWRRPAVSTCTQAGILYTLKKGKVSYLSEGSNFVKKKCKHIFCQILGNKMSNCSLCKVHSSEGNKELRDYVLEVLTTKIGPSWHFDAVVQDTCEVRDENETKSAT